METNILFYIYSFPVSDAVLFTWIIMFVLSLGSFLLTRKLEKIPRGMQHFLEAAVEGIENLVAADMGPRGKVFVPLILTIALFVFVANIISIIPGAMSPTADLTTTVALALLVFIVGHAAEIYYKGFGSWIKGFFEPFWFLFPINIVGEISQILSHSFRLFGNIFGGGILLGILYMLVPYVAPVPLLAWFGILMGVIQAGVFTMLAIAYIQIRLE
ncbi:MAG TPA: F0F1 ATP synthase subunit A [Firmicutes bacterium]|nr:F0F1 ATP synthase subunit A [Bacillota bacterium]